MKNKEKVWTFSRISPQAPETLLGYQRDLLNEYANNHEMEIIGETNIISNGKWINSFEMETLLIKIRRHEFNTILVYSPSRISIFNDIYEEFVMFCNMHNIKVLSVSKEVA